MAIADVPDPGHGGAVPRKRYRFALDAEVNDLDDLDSILQDLAYEAMTNKLSTRTVSSRGYISTLSDRGEELVTWRP
jgi:hypothetical protein